MAQPKRVNVWYDEPGDFLDVTWENEYGYFTPTEDDRVMVRLDSAGNVLGFKIEDISSIKGQPLEVDLAPPDSTPAEA